MKEYFKKIYKGTTEEFYKLAHDNLINENKMFVITANPETIMIAEENNDLKEAFFSKDSIVVPDGIGIVKGAKMLGIKEINKTITGIEFVKYLLEECNMHKKSLFLFGAKEEVVTTFEKKIKEKYSGIKVLGAVNGYTENKEKVFNDIKKKKPDVILVALGIPNQEVLIYNNLKGFDKGIFVGVGGTFDVLSGLKKRAPNIFLKHNLEWLYRITREPKRMRRFFKSNVKFLREIRKERKNN